MCLAYRGFCRFALLLLAAFLAGCKPPEESNVSAIVGAVLIDGAGGPPVSDSVVLISGSRISGAGPRGAVSIPQGSEAFNGAGKFMVPALVDLGVRMRACQIGPEPGAVDAARRRVDECASRKPDAIVLAAGLARAAADAALDQARQRDIPVFVRISTLAAARAAVDGGAAGLLGMIQDSEDIPRAFLAKLRDLRVIVAPELAAIGASARPLAMRNTRRCAESGVLIAVSAGQGATAREIELLAEAGIPPGAVIVAATRNGALALRKTDDFGTIAVGRQADLMLVSGNPMEDVRNLQKVDRVMRDGKWLAGS